MDPQAQAHLTSQSGKSKAAQNIIPIPTNISEELFVWIFKTLSDDCLKMKSLLDLSDGVVMAKLIAHYHPKLFVLYNYTPSTSNAKKLGNWNHLNSRVLPKLGISLTRNEIRDLAQMKPSCLETFLRVKKILQPHGTDPPSAPIVRLSRERKRSLRKPTVAGKRKPKPRCNANSREPNLRYRAVSQSQSRPNTKPIAVASIQESENGMEQKISEKTVEMEWKKSKKYMETGRKNSENAFEMERKKSENSLAMERKKSENAMERKKSEQAVGIERRMSVNAMEMERKKSTKSIEMEPRNSGTAIEFECNKSETHIGLEQKKSENAMEISRLREISDQKVYNNLETLVQHLQKMKTWMTSAYELNLAKVYEKDAKLFGVHGRIRTGLEKKISDAQVLALFQQLRLRRTRI